MPLVSFPREAENLCFSDLFRGYRKRSVAWNGLILKLPQILRNQLHSPICSQCTLSLPFEITRKPKVFWCFSGSRERVHCEQMVNKWFLLCLAIHTIWENTTQKKWSFPLRISLVNVNKSAGNCVFVHFY